MARSVVTVANHVTAIMTKTNTKHEHIKLSDSTALPFNGHSRMWFFVSFGMFLFFPLD